MFFEKIRNKRHTVEEANEEYIRIVNEANAQHDFIIQHAIEEAEQERNRIKDEETAELIKAKEGLENNISTLRAELKDLESLVSQYSSNPWDSLNLTKSEYKTKLEIIKYNIDMLIGSGRAAEPVTPVSSSFELDLLQYRASQAILSFCCKADLLILLSTKSTFAIVNRKIAKSYKEINKIYEKDNVKITKELLYLKAQQCVAYYYANK